MQILDENAVQECMNEIKSLLRRAHRSPQPADSPYSRPGNLEGYVRSPARRSGVREGDLT